MSSCYSQWQRQLLSPQVHQMCLWRWHPGTSPHSEGTMLPRKRYVTTVMQTCLKAVRRQHHNGCRHNLKEALLPVETSQNTMATLGKDLTMQKWRLFLRRFSTLQTTATPQIGERKAVVVHHTTSI